MYDDERETNTETATFSKILLRARPVYVSPLSISLAPLIL